MCRLEDYDSLQLLPAHRETLKSELHIWHKHYLPIGKTVLDVGAGCGETAYFYLRHGAERVICIESNPEAIRMLHANFNHDARVLILEATIDSVKVDIEGGEDKMVLETHFIPYFKHLHTFNHSYGISLWKIQKSHIVIPKTLHSMRITIAHALRVLWDSL